MRLLFIQQGVSKVLNTLLGYEDFVLLRSGWKYTTSGVWRVCDVCCVWWLRCVRVWCVRACGVCGVCDVCGTRVRCVRAVHVCGACTCTVHECVCSACPVRIRYMCASANACVCAFVRACVRMRTCVIVLPWVCASVHGFV